MYRSILEDITYNKKQISRLFNFFKYLFCKHYKIQESSSLIDWKNSKVEDLYDITYCTKCGKQFPKGSGI